MEFNERIITSIDTITYTLVFGFLLLAILRYRYPNRFTDVLQLPLNTKFFRIYGKEDIFRHPFHILFFFFQTINVSVFLYILISNVSNHAKNPWLLWQIITFYSIFIIGKSVVEKMLANIFSIDDTIDTYLFQKLGYRNLISILFFVFNLIMLYGLSSPNQVASYFLILILALNLAAMISIFRANRQLISSYFLYFILYLCALEISPYIILYKLVIDNRF